MSQQTADFFDWRDPLLLEADLSDEERLVQDNIRVKYSESNK